jgi:hypothetical protein
MNISFWANNNECVVVGMKVLEMRMSATRHFHKCDDIQFFKISFKNLTLNLSFMGVCNI